jgi:hypothetical protein
MLPFTDTLSNTLIVVLVVLAIRAFFLINSVRKLAERYRALLERPREEEVG